MLNEQRATTLSASVQTALLWEYGLLNPINLILNEIPQKIGLHFFNH